jgi:5-methylthioadenosine/S-adenosylhomocysteine deaminase
VDALEMLPMFNVVSHLVYVATRDRVSDVWVCGARLLAGRTLTTIREADLLTRTRAWNDKLLAYKNSPTK